MEGPSIHRLADRLEPLEGQRIEEATGNARQPIGELEGRRIERVRAVKKRLVVETDGPAAVVHFYMYGTYRINERREVDPRLSLRCEEDEFTVYSCSAKVWSAKRVREELDPKGDVLLDAFDADRARRALATREEPVADVLLYQSVFGGVGKIVKNEALWRAGVPPKAAAGDLAEADRERVFDEAVGFTEAWYERGGPYPAERGLRIYRAGECPRCGSDVTRERVGEWDRITFWCPACQRLDERRGIPPRPPVADG